MSAPKVIAEIGCNHKGVMATALEMIGVAATFCKVDYVKFQKRSNRELLTSQQYEAPHPNPAHAYGSTYGAHREFLEFSIEQHQQLKEQCERFGIGYASSVWDLTSARLHLRLSGRIRRPPRVKAPARDHSPGTAEHRYPCARHLLRTALL